MNAVAINRSLTMQTTGRTGRVTEAVISRKAFRFNNGYTSAEAKREYASQVLSKFNQAASAQFSALTTDGVHHCTRIGHNPSTGSFTFAVRKIAPTVASVSNGAAAVKAENVQLQAQLEDQRKAFADLQAQLASITLALAPKQ